MRPAAGKLPGSSEDGGTEGGSQPTCDAGSEVEPKTHWQEANALTTAPPLFQRILRSTERVSKFDVWSVSLLVSMIYQSSKEKRKQP